MRKSILIKGKPYSVNAMYYGDARTQKTEFKEWTYQMFHELSSTANLSAMQELRQAFDPNKHAFKVRITVYYPADIYKTKEGRISGRTMDLSNFEKPLMDLLFDKKFFERPHPYGVQNINTNDSYVTELHSYKKAGTEHRIKIDITIISN
jgi:Holliday junction resolvase RusA-like endonuclease